MKKKFEENWPPVAKPWMDRVNYDWETARAMHQSGRYLYVVFMCQQAIEKTLKAVLAFQNKEIKPIHNLSKLAELANILQEFDNETHVIKKPSILYRKPLVKPKPKSIWRKLKR